MASKDLHMLRELEFVRKYELDDVILTLSIEGVTYSVMLPEEYPRGEPCIFGETSESLLPGNLESIAYQVLQFHQCGGNERMESDSPSMSREMTGMMMLLPQVDPALAADLESFKKRFGAAAVEHRSLDTSDWISIHVPVNNLITAHVATAWGVNRTQPITVRIKFDTKAYTDQRSAPKVDMFQGEEKFALGQQMTRVLTNYLSSHWKTGHFVPPQATSGSRAPAPVRAESGSDEDTTSSAPRADLKAHQFDIYGTLMEMDFAEEYAWKAAAACDTVEEALDWQPPTKKSKKGGKGAVKNFTGSTEDTKAAFADPSSTVYDARKDPGKIVLYDRSGGFLCHLADVLYKRIPSCSKYCVICDKPHLFGAGSMLRPAVCTRDVCVFAFQELNVGSDAAETVATDAGVIDLLVNLFRLAAYSNRATDILTPYPQVPDPQNKNKMFFDPANKDFNKLKKVLEIFPSVQQVVQSEDLASLRARLDTQQPAAYPLLEWVINSNRSHIVKMAEAQHLPSMGTKHQFLLITAAPEKQRKFDELKKKHGTKYAFHGSGAENWHTILRCGLKNVSGTKLQLNGAAHGAGIYFAPDAQTSIGYCRAGTIPKGSHTPSEISGQNFISETNMICLALCEIVKTEIKDHGWCWTVQNEDAVMTRFFFVYDQTSASSSASTKNGSFVDKEVKKVLDFHGLTD